MDHNDLKARLDQKVEEMNTPRFIQDDPISIPHEYTDARDIEIAGFFAAVLAWGQRKTIINKCRALMQMMDNAPYQFITGHRERDLKPITAFVHRTFNATDALYFIEKLQTHYRQHDSLEAAFLPGSSPFDMQSALVQFNAYFFDLPFAPQRTQKHVPTPAKQSACKRLNLYLRWMVRRDDKGVDLGIWRGIPMSALVCPLDVHVGRAARRLGLLSRRQTDWLSAVELTENLKQFDPKDPVKYDFALFGIGLLE